MLGWGVGDIVLNLAVTVHAAYKDGPQKYRHISDEVSSFQIILDKAMQYFNSTTLSDKDRQESQKVLKGCQSVLEDLNSFIEKYKSSASATKSQKFKAVKLGTEDFDTLRARLISNTVLLNRFILRFDIFTISVECIMLILLLQL